MSSPKSYGNPPLIQKVTLMVSLLVNMPLVLLWTALSYPFHPSRSKSLKRAVSDRSFRYLTKHSNVKQLQWLLGTTQSVYERWTKENRLPMVIDELGEDSRLLWIGERRTDRVILYFHGGGYMFPLSPYATTFWNQAVSELKNRGIETGLTILNYSLLPTTTFLTQLKQAVLALEYLILQGVKPENIQLAGDSAGAGIIFALISHLLHPLDDVPWIKLSSPIRSVFIMSAWVNLSYSHREGSLVSNDGIDVVNTDILAEWGRQILCNIPDSQIPYIEPIKTSKSWFKQMNTIVGRILITTGETELSRDDIAGLAERICEDHAEARFIIHKKARHNDPYYDVLTKDSIGELTPIIWDWLADGFITP